MAKDFFKAKRYWSQYKDFILGYYLPPYIAKVKELGRPILIVDCFAGPGKFEDGNPGSPLIILSAVRKWRERGVSIRAEFIEADAGHFQRLEALMSSFAEYGTPRFGSFQEQLTEIAAKAEDHSVFLYVDPYSVRGLDYAEMASVYAQIQRSRSSIEVLLNLNSPIFLRWALAALKRHNDIVIPATEDEEPIGVDTPSEGIEIETLNAIAGGDYWKAIAQNAALSFAEQVLQFTVAYQRRMSESFKWVCRYGVKAKYQHSVPKYCLIYGTRHRDGVLLMNDTMCSARRAWLREQFQEGMLFDSTPSSETTGAEELCEELMRIVREHRPITRKELRLLAIQELFCRSLQKEYNAAVATLLKSGRLYSSTGKTRINDRVLLSDQPFS